MIEEKYVSAVVFAFNEEKHIKETLDSIESQKEVDKIIFIDDQSTDMTVDIVLKYEGKIEIEIYKNENKGKANAFALGLSKVNTELFFVCHGDDILLSGYVEKLYLYIKEKSIEFCYANSIECDINMTPIRDSVVKESYLDIEILNRNSIGGYIFGYSKIIKNIIPFPKGLTFEDWFTNIKLVCFYNKLYVYVPPTFLYRRHLGSDSIKLNKTLSGRSYELLRRILHENLILLNAVQRIKLNKTKERYYEISLAMDYLFLKPNKVTSPNILLKCKYLSFYLKSLIRIKKIFNLDQQQMLKLDTYLIQKIKSVKR